MPDDFSQADLRHMHRALAMARRGQGKVEPNPMVGAAVVKNGVVVGEGFHQRFGGNHAEVHALLAAGKNTRGATLYVTLEPCCHWGKTPPCTEAILHTGIARVVVAMVDPFAEVHGRGIRILRKNGVRVDVGLLEGEAREMNAPFMTRLTERRPYVIAKWAQSIDGKVALGGKPAGKLASRKPVWISSEVSRGAVQKLRGRVDGIVVGIQTALADNPLLTARPENRRYLMRTATRIVLDSQCRLPVSSRLLATVATAPLLIAHARKLGEVAERRRAVLAGRGAMTIALATDKTGRPRITELLEHLADLEYANLLVEGGPRILGSFLQENLIDEAHVFMAPLVIGGSSATGAFAGGEIRSLADAGRFRVVSHARSGPDLHVVLRRNDA